MADASAAADYVPELPPPQPAGLRRGAFIAHAASRARKQPVVKEPHIINPNAIAVQNDADREYLDHF